MLVGERSYKVQVAIDVVEEAQALRVAGVVGEACRSGALDCSRVIVEAGTPLIKVAGMQVIPRLKLASSGVSLMADLKTADVGQLEASLAYSYGADSVSVLALAPPSTIKAVLETGKAYDRAVVVDFIGVYDLRRKATEIAGAVREVGIAPERVVFEFHRGIDEERGRNAGEFFREVASVVSELRRAIPGVQVAIAGGITPQLKHEIERVLDVDIYVVGRYITSSPSVDRLLEFF